MTTLPPDALERAVNKALAKEIASLTEAEINSAVANFEKQLRSRVALTALSVSAMFDMHRHGQDLVITIKTPEIPRA